MDLLKPPHDFPADVRRELIEARDLTRHWVENMPVFNSRPRIAEPPRRSGRSFAEHNPHRSPYGFWSWESRRGAMLTPHVSAPELHCLLDKIEARALSDNPKLATFLPTRRDSPWIEDASAEGYFPKVES
jgi:hypothetical protein